MQDNSWLIITSTIVWPICLLILLIVFKKEVINLFNKFKNDIDELDNKDSENLKVTIDDLITNDEFYFNDIGASKNKKLERLHPISLYILIELGLGIVSSSSWIKFKVYILSLYDKGLININSDINLLHKNEFIHNETIELSLTHKGNIFLDEIGFRDKIDSYN